MAKWQSFYKLVQQTNVSTTTVTDNQALGLPSSFGSQNWYHKLIHGSGSRLSRYREWDMMDSDIDISRALDLLAEEITGNCSKTDEPVELNVIDIDHMSSSEVTTIKTALRHWNEMHKWKSRMFDVARYTVKFGDIFFRKKDQISKWVYIHPKDVVGAIVNNEDVTDIKGWQIHTALNEAAGSMGTPTSNISGQSATENYSIDEIVRFSLNNDMSENAPFGESVLKPIYKTFKQKELLEDAVIIYRIERAPERRVFYIDVGKMPPNKVKTYLEGIKNEIRQKKIPTHNGQNSQIESAYNPHCISLDTKINLIDRRRLTLSEIISEYEDGKKLQVYSIDQKTKKRIIGDISWAGVTRRNTIVVKLELDNGQYLICTPDHKMIRFDGSEVEAQNLVQYEQLLHSADLQNPGPIPINNDVRVNSIEFMSDMIDTGCLTITDDGNNHNFAICPGIFIKNSQREDFFLAQRCISFETRIPLLNGMVKTLSELITDYHNGLENWVYSVDITSGKYIPGKIEWAGATRQNAEMVRLTLDNDMVFDCTIDHECLTSNLKKVQAQHLTKGIHLSTLYIDQPSNLSLMVKDIEFLTTRQHTGCLTIVDPGDNHNFAIESGIYICNSDGRGSKIETLPGGQSTGEISDVEYFSDKLFRGLRIPLSYMKEGDSGNAVFSDGKVGQAYITELRFSLYIGRLQSLLEEVLDKEFKSYLRYINIRIDNTKFKLTLPEPSNFGKYREQEMYAALLSSYSSADGIPYLSKKFIMRKFLQLTNDEILENERMKLEEVGENPDSYENSVLTKIYAPDSITDDVMDGSPQDPRMDMIPDDSGSGNADVPPADSTLDL